MNYKVIATGPFERKVKKLSKKYISIKTDLQILFKSLETNPTQGVSLGNDSYKIRLSISSKGKGKSGGARVITFVKVVKSKVFLMTIYDKSERYSISDNEIQRMIKHLQNMT